MKISKLFKKIKPLEKIGRIFQKTKIRIDGSSQASNILLKEFDAIYFSIPKAASRTLRLKFSDVLDLDGLTPYSISFPYATKSDLDCKYSKFFKFCFVRNPWDRLASVYFGKFQRGIELNRPFYKAKIYHFFKKFKINISFLYKYPVLVKEMTFDEFIEAVCQTPDKYLDKHLKSQHKFIPMVQGSLKLDYVGKIESFKEDLDFVFKRIGLDENKLKTMRYRGYKQKLSESEKKSLKPFPYYYNKHTWNLVRERFKTDIELFYYDETWHEALAKYE
ncbi:MAG: sulfotransferase family protein [Moorea sp. SIO2I5]|nr:sulfotransferase family protein [Moorena sp. SIO2I5]